MKNKRRTADRGQKNTTKREEPIIGRPQTPKLMYEHALQRQQSYVCTRTCFAYAPVRVSRMHPYVFHVRTRTCFTYALVRISFQSGGMFCCCRQSWNTDIRPTDQKPSIFFLFPPTRPPAHERMAPACRVDFVG